MKKFKPLALGASAFIYSLLTLQTAIADDTEIYVPKDLPADQQVRPNIMFVLDSSGSMGSTVANSGNRSRNRVMRDVVKDLIDQLKTKEDVNVGFMRYDGNDGGYVLSPVQRLTVTNATSMKNIVDTIPADGNTPLLETYYESYLYMVGKNRVWGDKSVASSLSGNTYKSPVTHSCQQSHIIYLTDGEPTQDTSSNAAVRTLVTNKNTLYPASSCGNGQGACLPHLAEYMANQDLFPAPAPFADPTNRKQTVTSHFVGFTVNLALLRNAAEAGGGKYYTTSDVSGLTDALKAIVQDISAENTSFATPSVAVSAFNNLGFRNDLYYALFRPAEGANWPGNVKRYKLSKDGSGNPLIVDKNGNAAIDDTTGFFRNSASSFWSAEDGSDVAKGGVAGRLLNPDTRKIFTWTTTDRTPSASAGVTGSQALDVAAHRLITGNTAVTQAMLGASTSALRTSFINWARGKKTDGTNRLAIADVLHNEPKLVAYVTDEDLARADNSPATSTEKLFMFFGSNEGFIHAIDPTNGDEKFAFIPKELLGNPGSYLTDAKGSSNKKYGMDGQINLWTEYRTPTADDIADKKRTLSKAYLYAGMRRGGSNYYSLDVTNIDAPAFKWLIKGAYSATPTPGFEKLGLTFSSPKLADIKINGTKTKVLIFSGGYDKEQDNIGANAPKNDSVGNSLFIADAETGKLLWRAGNTGDSSATLNVPNMTNSMPADPTIVDIDGDGLADIIYASDLRGQVFRFDIDNANTSLTSLATGGRIASLGGSTAADNRRFFNSPDVALIRERGGKTYFTISIGSGFRESPLNTETDDRFYVLRDSNVFTKPTTYTTIVESDLVNVSGVNLSDSEAATILAEIARLEALMASLNLALSTAQENFVSYKAGIGHTAKQNAALQALSDANDKQREIDEILANDPYLLEHVSNTQQQSTLQDSLVRAQQTLTELEHLRLNIQGLADAGDAGILDAERLAAETALTAAIADYNPAQVTADNDAAAATAAESAAVAAETIATADQATADAALITKNNADQAAADALTAAAMADAANTAADAALVTAAADAATTATNKTNAATDLTNAQTNVITAQNDVNNAQNALNTAQTNLDNDLLDGNLDDPNLVTIRDTAQTDLANKTTTLTNAQTVEATAVTALATATTADDAAQAVLNTATITAANAATAKATADALVTSTANTAATAANDLIAANNQAASSAATATGLRTTADSAQSTATASALDAANKLATRNAAQAARDTATQAHTTAVKNDADANAISAQLSRFTEQYDRLTQLQSSVDTSFSQLQAQEAALLAAKADPNFDANALPAMETALTAARANYAALATVATRANLNTGTPAKTTALINAVKAALALTDPSDVALALDAALDIMEADLDFAALPAAGSLTVSQLLARAESANSAALQVKAGNEATTNSLVAGLATQRDAFRANGAALQIEADALAGTAYDTASALLSAAQLTALRAQVAPEEPTTFDAYQYLIDVALANASSTVNGLPFLRNAINVEYSKLTPGNAYTPNTNLLAASKGFYLRLPRGEKVLSTSISFRGALFFSTFAPRNSNTVTTCGSDVGRGRTYALSLLDASALFTETATDGTKNPVRSFDLKRSGIPPTPSVILSEGAPTILTGTEILTNECIEGVEACRSGDAVKATYWREN